MKNSMLKTSIKEFIEERLTESYLRISKDKRYHKEKSEFLQEEADFNVKLKEKNLLNEYERIKNKKYSLDTFELEDAYKTGFKDSTNIYMNKDL